MTNGKKPGNNGNDKRNVVYLSVDLTKDMKSALQQWIDTQPDFMDLAEKALDSGLKMGWSFDHYNECFQATFTQLPKDAKNPVTIVLVGRGGTINQAFQALLYKYWVVLDTNMEDGDIRNPRGVTDWG